MQDVEKKAVQILQEETGKRTGISLQIQTSWPDSGTAVILAGRYDQILSRAELPEQKLDGVERPEEEGFVLKASRGEPDIVLTAGADARGVLYGVGRLLRKCGLAPGAFLIPEDLDLNTSPQN
jgi:hypothetical protein